MSVEADRLAARRALAQGISAVERPGPAANRRIQEALAASAASARNALVVGLTGAPGALAITKKQLRNCVPGDLSDQLSRAAVVSAEARGTPEAREGLAAFLSKRPPAWQRG